VTTRYEFAFAATPDLGPAALRCLLWKRGGIVGPIALVLAPLLLVLLASEPAWRPAAALLGGALVMLLVLFLLAVWHRRRVRARFFREASHRVVRVVMDEGGVSLSTALGDSRLGWPIFERLWRCTTVALLFYQGWQYVAIPAGALPEGAAEFAEARIREARRASR
jgi:hypothetical protein